MGTMIASHVAKSAETTLAGMSIKLPPALAYSFTSETPRGVCPYGRNENCFSESMNSIRSLPFCCYKTIFGPSLLELIRNGPHDPTGTSGGTDLSSSTVIIVEASNTVGWGL